MTKDEQQKFLVTCEDLVDNLTDFSNLVYKYFHGILTCDNPLPFDDAIIKIYHLINETITNFSCYVDDLELDNINMSENKRRRKQLEIALKSVQNDIRELKQRRADFIFVYAGRMHEKYCLLEYIEKEIGKIERLNV